MKLVSFEAQGRCGWGAVKESGIVDLSRALDQRYPTLQSMLQAGALEAVRSEFAGLAPEVGLDDVVLQPVIPNPAKIWCCGLNYGEHVREGGRQPTEQPTFFLRVAESQVGHGQPIVRPRESVQLDYEAEIAVIIGRPGRRIAEENAALHIAGYACYNDASVRDWQRHTSQWTPGKNFWRTGGFGPWMVTADEIPFGTTMSLVSRLNGVEMQRATTDLMIHSIARQIAYVSTVAPLAAGDVIVTGTPGGVGAARTPPVWLKAGDVIEVEVDRIGVLRNPVIDEET